MTRTTFVLVLVTVLLVVSQGRSGPAIEANNLGPAPDPLLTCGDVNGDGPVAGTDFFALLGKFGTAYPALTFSYLYDLNADGAVAGTDFFALLSDFGQDCPDADSEIARATLWALSVPGLMTENTSLLASLGYYGAPIDVPGQGVHYVNLSAGVWDAKFRADQPEGLVYDNGRLVAQLYYVNGDPLTGGVGWGPEPPPVDNADVDAFCTPVSGETACSWSNDSGPEPVDGWHLHFNLCVTWGGTEHFQFQFTGSASACEAVQDTHPEWGGTWFWSQRLGWMGHLWNHGLNGNGRLADCAPDPAGYQDFYGQKGAFGPYNCPQ